MQVRGRRRSSGPFDANGLWPRPGSSITGAPASAELLADQPSTGGHPPLAHRTYVLVVAAVTEPPCSSSGILQHRLTLLPRRATELARLMPMALPENVESSDCSCAQ